MDAITPTKGHCRVAYSDAGQIARCLSSIFILVRQVKEVSQQCSGLDQSTPIRNHSAAKVPSWLEASLLDQAAGSLAAALATSFSAFF